MPFQTINGIRIYYEEHGEGFPVLLIQGLGYPSGMWFLQIPDFSRNFRTIVFDNRGVGRTDKPDAEYSVTLMASDAAGLLKSLGVSKAHVVGVSLGGYIAQELALNQPDLVDHLVLMATSCGGPKYAEATKSFWQEVAGLAGLPPEEIIRRGMALATTGNFYQTNPVLIDRSVAVRMEKLQPLHAFIRQSHAAMSFDSSDRASHIGQPTLILAGAEDRVMPLALTEDLTRRIPQARLKVFPGSAHLLFLEEAPALNRLIIEFLLKDRAV